MLGRQYPANYFDFTPLTFMLITELATSFTFSGGMFRFLMIAFAVGSLAMHSIGKEVSSITFTSWNPAAFMASIYSSLLQLRSALTSQ